MGEEAKQRLIASVYNRYLKEAEANLADSCPKKGLNSNLDEDATKSLASDSSQSGHNEDVPQESFGISYQRDNEADNGRGVDLSIIERDRAVLVAMLHRRGLATPPSSLAPAAHRSIASLPHALLPQQHLVGRASFLSGAINPGFVTTDSRYNTHRGPINPSSLFPRLPEAGGSSNAHSGLVSSALSSASPIKRDLSKQRRKHGNPIPFGQGEGALVPESTLIVTGPFPSTTIQDGVVFPPLRPLSAYNYFFRDEREHVLKHMGLEGRRVVLNQSHCDKLLRDHWGRDRTTRRLHRKSHGKISFQELSKLISSRWKKLPVRDKQFYQQVADIDLKRFKAENG